MSSLRVIPRSTLHSERYDERTKWVNDHAPESNRRKSSLNSYSRAMPRSEIAVVKSQLELQCCF